MYRDANINQIIVFFLCVRLSPFTVHPVINVRNQLVGSPFEKDVTIECSVEASPKSINYWIKDTGKENCCTYTMKISTICVLIAADLLLNAFIGFI